MMTRHSPGAWTALAAVLLGGMFACGGDDADPTHGIAVPRGATLPPLAITMSPTYSAETVVPRPDHLDGHVYLRVDQDGTVTGALSAESVGAASVAAVTGHVEGDTIVLAPAELSLSGSSFGWDELRLSLLDTDGDRVPDGAIGDAAGTWTNVGGDVVDSSHVTATISGILDTVAGTAAFLALDTIQPFEALTVAFTEPVRADQATTSLRVLAGGVAVPGRFEVTPIDGLIGTAVFHPTDFLPFDQAITLELGALADPSGNALSVDVAPLRVVPDPAAPVTDNLGFEHGLSGWVVVGEAEASGVFSGVAPPEGTSQAVVHAFGSLAAYIDVPANAQTLHVSVTRLSALPEVDADYTGVVALHRADGETIVGFDTHEVAASVAACTTCDPAFAFQIGPIARDIDLEPFRGQRMWLTLEARAFSFIGVPALAVLFDDLHVTTTP